jgi:drug/metabolite transporter (DMT)-like permease
LKPKDWLAFTALGMIWGSSFLWIKLAVNEVGPVMLVAFRLLFGILGLLLVVLINRPKWPTSRKAILLLALFGFTNNAIPYVMISWGEQYIDSSVAAILNSSTPLFTMLIAHWFLNDDRLTFRRVAGLLVGFGGIIILLSRGLENIVLNSFWGEAAVVFAAFCYGASSVLARATSKGVSPVMGALVPLFGADAFLWALTPIAEKPFRLPTLPITWLAMAWLGIMGTGVAFLLYFYLLRSVGPTRTTLTNYIFPLVGVLLGVVFLKEQVDWHLLVGGALIVGSIVVVNQSNQKKGIHERAVT